MPELLPILSEHFPAVATAALILLLFAMPKSPVFRLVVVGSSLALTFRYILWRGVYTLNTADYAGIGISATLLAAELYGVVQYLFFLYQGSRSKKRIRPELDEAELPTVDVFITVYNEPTDVLTRTVVGCMAQDYPPEKLTVYVLDDGRREEVKEVCGKTGSRYITRADNADAKAGNINNALRNTGAEVVAIFDCDHVPVRTFLAETVPFLKDPEVGFVQVPHHFYNPDIFQRNLRLESEIVNEQDLFFKVIEPGRDYYNSAFFAGSCGLFRRKALSETGGMMAETLTEDIHTSMELHSRGWKSVFVNKVLSAGLAPENSASYVKQRERWAEGGIQLFLLDNPLFKKGLSFHQRLNYFASITYFFHGLPRIVYLSAPLAFLLFGYAPLVTDLGTLLYYFLPHYAAQLIAFNAISRGFRNPFWSDVYETLMSFGITRVAARTVLRPRDRPFMVTPKGLVSDDRGMDLATVLPHSALLCMLLAGGLLGIRGMALGVDADALTISVAWTAYNALLLVAALVSAAERPQRRKHLRLKRKIPCEIEPLDKKLTCVTTDISEGGISVRLDSPAFFQEKIVRVRLTSVYGEVTTVKGEVIREDTLPSGDITLGISFLNVDDAARQSLIRQMYSPEDSWSEEHGDGSSVKIIKNLLLLVSALARSFVREKLLKRVSPRFSTRFPCEINIAGVSFGGATRNVSATGLAAEVEGINELPPSLVVSLNAGGESIVLAGKLVWQVKKGKKVVFGMKFSESMERRKLWTKLSAA